MLYYLFDYLDNQFDLPGAGLFQFLSFRAAVAGILSLLISTIYGKRIINFLRKQQVGETVRDLGLIGQNEKAGTPTMGGVIIILATLIPVLFIARLDNVYIILLIVTTLWMGTIGFVDDYIKIFKKDKQGLKGRFKVLGQIGLGIIVGATLYFHPEVTIKREKQLTPQVQQEILSSGPEARLMKIEEKSTKTTIPLLRIMNLIMLIWFLGLVMIIKIMRGWSLYLL